MLLFNFIHGDRRKNNLPLSTHCIQQWLLCTIEWCLLHDKLLLWIQQVHLGWSIESSVHLAFLPIFWLNCPMVSSLSSIPSPAVKLKNSTKIKKQFRITNYLFYLLSFVLICIIVNWFLNKTIKYNTN